MEFRLGSFIFNERQSANCNVDSLVVIERPRIQNYESIIRSRPAASPENFSVRKIQYGRAFGSLHRSFLKPFLPNMVGRDHVVGKPAGPAFDCGKHPKGTRAPGALEFARIEFR